MIASYNGVLNETKENIQAIVLYVFSMDVMYVIESFISLEDCKCHQDKCVIQLCRKVTSHYNFMDFYKLLKNI
jgi:hypothetical protein